MKETVPVVANEGDPTKGPEENARHRPAVLQGSITFITETELGKGRKNP